jgi:hypothetical protein
MLASGFNDHRVSEQMDVLQEGVLTPSITTTLVGRILYDRNAIEEEREEEKISSSSSRRRRRGGEGIKYKERNTLYFIGLDFG